MNLDCGDLNNWQRTRTIAVTTAPYQYVQHVAICRATSQIDNSEQHLLSPQIATFMGPTWGPPGSCRPQMSPICAPQTLLSGACMLLTPQNPSSFALFRGHIHFSIMLWNRCWPGFRFRMYLFYMDIENIASVFVAKHTILIYGRETHIKWTYANKTITAHDHTKGAFQTHYFESRYSYKQHYYTTCCGYS